MKRDNIIKIMKDNPGIKVTHDLFSSDEYIYIDESGDVRDEKGYLFDDWVSIGIGAHNGLRIRSGGNWEDGWDIKFRKKYVTIPKENLKWEMVFDTLLDCTQDESYIKGLVTSMTLDPYPSHYGAFNKNEFICIDGNPIESDRAIFFINSDIWQLGSKVTDMTGIIIPNLYYVRKIGYII